VTDGNARYAKARRRALTRAADPSRAQPAGRRDDVPDPRLPCRCTGDDPLPHSGTLHHLTAGGNRTWCSVVSEAGPCPCQRYND
jgi:hypothetical protein